MQKKLVVSSSPFLRNQRVSTRGLMLDVVIALLPTALAAVWFFGRQALSLILVSVIFAVGSEWLFEKIFHKKSTIGDLSAVVTGLLLVFNLPAGAPWWVAAVGAVLAIVLVKQFFGGLGQNFMNPALAARTILMLSWTALMNQTVAPSAGQLFGLGQGAADAVAMATPLAKNAGSFTLWQLFSGNIPGMLGETCKLTLLLGGIYLIVRGVISFLVPGQQRAARFRAFLDPDGNDLFCGERLAESSVSAAQRRSDAGRFLHGDGLCDQPHYQAGPLDHGHWLRFDPVCGSLL